MKYDWIMEYVDSGCLTKDAIREKLNRLAEIEDKIEQGTLIELPCKVGDTVYQTDGVRIYESETEDIMSMRNGFIFDCKNFAFDERAIGERIFLTREEAEKRLKELQE